jgi:hypothetical protein
VPKSKPAPTKISGKISEVSPPEAIQQLREVLDRYQPQVEIVAPRSNQVLEDNTVSVKLQVKDLPLFKDAKLGLGPHVHLFLDDQPYQAVYDASQPVVLKDLAPGTHTLRAFASRPWHESFKNEGAYAQTTFHVFTKTPNHNPDPAQPLLTYSRPQGSYGAEPIMLDFYLTNAPLHFVAQEDKTDEVEDWRIRVTVNGSSFVLDRWQPIYLKGFEPGKNWVQLEYIDENGNSIQNVYNNLARLFTYEPGGSDTLSKLVRGDLSFEAARGIVDPNYKPAEPSPAPEVIRVPAPQPSPSPTPEAKPVPEAKPAPLPLPIFPAPETTDQLPAEPQKAPAINLKDKQEEASKATPSPEGQSSEKPKGGFFNRFRPNAGKPVPDVVPSPVPSQVPEVIKAKEAEPQKPEVKLPEPEAPAAKIPEIKTPEVKAPEVKETPKSGFFNRSTPSKGSETAKARKPEAEKPGITLPKPEVKAPESKPEVKTPEVSEPKVKTPEVKETPKGDSLNRSTSPKVPESVKAKKPEAENPEVKIPKPEVLTPDGSRPELKTPEVSEPGVKTPEVKETPKEGFFNRFNRRRLETPAPAVSPVPSTEPEKSIEAAPKKTPSDSVLERSDRSSSSTKPAPKDVSGTATKVKDLQSTETKVPELVTPKVKETPKVTVPDLPGETTKDRFRRPVSTPTPQPSVKPSETAPAAKAEETSEEPVKMLEPATPASQPKKSFLDRFRRPTAAPKTVPSVTPSPQVPTPPALTAPANEGQDTRETRRSEPARTSSESKVNSSDNSAKDNLVDRLRRAPATPKPTPLATPSTSPRVTPLPTVERKESPIETKIPKTPESSAPVFKKPAPLEKSTAQPPKSEPSAPQPSAAPDFQPQTELERRLGIPLKPRSETTLEKPAPESTLVPTAQ